MGDVTEYSVSFLSIIKITVSAAVNNWDQLFVWLGKRVIKRTMWIINNTLTKYYIATLGDYIDLLQYKQNVTWCFNGYTICVSVYSLKLYICMIVFQ